MNRETQKIVDMFNDIAIKQYAKKHNDNPSDYSDEKKVGIIEMGQGPISVGAVYKWPALNGNKFHVIGFGLIEDNSGVHFLASYNSKKLGRPSIQKLKPEEVLRMIEWGEVEYLGSIFDRKFREEFDYERLSLAVIGLVSMTMSTRMERNVSVDEIMDKMERGEMTLDDLLKQCQGISQQDVMGAM